MTTESPPHASRASPTLSRLALALALPAALACADRSPPARFPTPPPPELAEPIDADVPIEDAAQTQPDPPQLDAAPE